MVDLNGAGSASVGGLSVSGSGQSQWWHVVIDAPVLGQVVNTTTPQVFTTLDSWNSGSAQVQVQVSLNSAFSSTVHDTTIVQSDGVSAGRNVTALADETDYYIRARAGDGAGHWGPWSDVTWFHTSLNAGRGFLYSTVNVGVEVTMTDEAIEYVYENVGVAVTMTDEAIEYVYENVGVADQFADSWSGYIYEGDVNADTPNPHIWFLKPSSGRAGDGIAIFGFGFGDLQSTFTGQVEVDYGGVTGWVAIPVTSWQTFPANNAAYTEDRMIAETTQVRPAIYYDDQFDADGALVDPWIMIGGAWVAAGGEVNPTTGTSRRIAVIDGLADGTLEVVLGSTDAKLAFRVQDVDNLLYFDPSTRQVRRVLANVDAQIGSTGSGTAGAIGDRYTVALSGASIIVRKNGTQILSTSTTSFQTEDKHGLLGTANTAKFRSFNWDSAIEITDLIDVQHTVIDINVPSDAIQPGYPVRVRTDGP